MLEKIICSLMLGVFLCGISYGENFTECDNKQPGTYVEDPNNCLQYIYCDNDNSEKGYCPEETPYFSKDDRYCVNDENICENKPKINSTTAAPTAITSTTTTRTTTITATTTHSTSTTQKPISNNTNTLVECPSVDDPNNPIFIANNKSCSEYYLCFHGQPLTMHCADMLQFDMKQQRCDIAEHVKCQMDSVPPREQCLPHTVDVYPHPHKCNYYYKCELGYLMIMQCPFNEGWDYEKRVCVLMPKAKCYDSVHRDE